MKRPSRSEETLKSALDEFSQQIVALRMTADAHEAYLRHGGHPPIILNSLVGSFAIHFRNILDFLYSGGYDRSPSKSDVIAEDFFPSAIEWRSLVPPISETAKKDRQRLNKQIAHITYDKIGVPKEDLLWHFNRNLSDVSPGIQAFYSHVDRRFLGKDFDKELRHPVGARRLKIKRPPTEKIQELFSFINF